MLSCEVMPARLLFPLLCLATTIACGPAQDAKPPIPPSPKFVAGNLEPMIVDWQPEERGDLEISMREGLVVVGYDQQGFRLLKDCHVDGTYEFMGMTRRERVVRLESAEDVRANLPLGGLGIAAKLGGELERGATLDIAMVMVGKLRTTWRTVTAGDLVGQCQHASHFVRGATVGAFAVDKGDRSHARAVAEIFGLGVGGGTAKSSQVRVTDGQLTDCQRATPDSDKAPTQCGALIRVELLPIASSKDDPKAKALAEREPSLVDACPAPLVRIEGKCTEPRAQVAAECNYADGRACLEACQGQNTRSCVKLAMMLYHGNGVPQSVADSAKLAAQACAAQDPAGCLFYGDVLLGGEGIAHDPARAAQIFAKACDDGEAEACERIGTMLLVGRGIARDTATAARALSKGCKGGSHNACSDFGLLALGGQGFQKDLPTAAALFKRACDGNSAVGCSNLAYLEEFGNGVPKSTQLAFAHYGKGCELDPSQCTWLGAMHQVGNGVPKNETKAIELYRTACRGGSTVACAIVRAYLDPAQQVDPEGFKLYVNLWTTTCQADGPRDCSGLGVLALVSGQAEQARSLYTRGCKLGDAWGCMLASLRQK